MFLYFITLLDVKATLVTDSDQRRKNTTILTTDRKTLRIWLVSSDQYNFHLCQVWLLILLTCFILPLSLSQQNNNLQPPHHVWNCHHNNVKYFRLSRKRVHVTLRWVRYLKGWVLIFLLLSFNFEIILAFTTLEQTVRLSSSGTLP